MTAKKIHHAEQTPALDQNNPAEKIETAQSSPITSDGITQEEKILGAIGYISAACLLPLSMKPNSKFCQFHGKQGLILFPIGIFCLFLLIAHPLLIIFFLSYFALAVIAFYRAYNGEMWKIPLVGNLAEKINIGGKPTVNNPPNKEQPAIETEKKA